jgi:hypothetical protein
LRIWLGDPKAEYGDRIEDALRTYALGVKAIWDNRRRMIEGRQYRPNDWGKRRTASARIED